MKCWVMVFGMVMAAAATPVVAENAKLDFVREAAQMAAHPPADLDGYYALKQRLGDSGLMRLRQETSLLALRQAGAEAGASFPACRMPDWELTAAPALDLAMASPTEADWKANLAAIQSALAKRDSFRAKVMRGEAADPLFNGAAWVAKKALTATTPRQKAFAERYAADQFVRNSSTVIQNRALWADGVNPAVLAYLSGLGTAESCRVDRANTEWLKGDLKANGWPRVSVFGPELDNQAWLLVQHADHDVPFQKYVLSLLEALLPTKDTSLASYAYLYDRVALAEKRPQRYGTQGRCTGPAKWEPFEGEDPARLDARRAEVGLGPEAEYQTHFSFCTAEMAAMSAMLK